MIDYDKPDEDPIVAEVRRFREEILASFNYDLRAYLEHVQSLQATSGRKYAVPPPRTLTAAPESAKKVG